jgi:hypothetical protein
VEKVEIQEMKEGTFYAELSLSGPDGTASIDARPSDCLALAIRAGAPIEDASSLSNDDETDVDVTMTREHVDSAIEDLISSAGLEAGKGTPDNEEDAPEEDPDTTLRKLRWRLELAVKGEDYERAAQIRDRIYAQETSVVSPVESLSQADS